MDKALVIGMGEIGTALAKVLLRAHEVYVSDVGERVNRCQSDIKHTWRIANEDPQVDVMHICFPYSKVFIADVQSYRERFNPKDLVIHSTVPPGTSYLCGAVHSPVIGLHPNLEQSLLTFTKFIGGQMSGDIADHLRAAGMRVYLFPSAYTTELLKILSTTFYALMIEWTKEVDLVLAAGDISYSAWTIWTQAYNEGYQALGRPEYTRPQLIPLHKRLGGHCLLSNCEFIKDDSEFARIILKRNKA